MSEETKPKKSKKKKIIIIVAAALVLAVLIIVNLKKGKGDAIEVSVAKIKRGDITKTVSGSGRVQPETDVDIAARISAEIIKIHVNEGELVEKGQLLVELDRQRYEAIVEQAESQLKISEATLKKAEADYTRTRDLFRQNLVSQAELDAAEALKEQASGQLQQARASLKQFRDDLAKTKLTSPITGTVTKLYKEEGEIAIGSQFQADIIMNVADLNLMEVVSEIDENEVVVVEIGDSAKIEVDAIPDTLFDGIVTEIAHMATTRGAGTQEQVTNFEVKIRITTDTQKLRPGMSSTVDIMTDTHEDVFFVPIQCVTAREMSSDTTKANEDRDASKEEEASENDEQTDDESKKVSKEVVFIVDAEVVKMIPVKTGISDDNNIEIVSEVEEGQEVVSGNYRALSRLLKDGSRIKIKKDGSLSDSDRK